MTKKGTTPTPRPWVSVGTCIAGGRIQFRINGDEDAAAIVLEEMGRV